MEEIINRVASSPLITIDLEQLLPDESIMEFDLASILYEGIILKEKDFRSFVKSNDWSIYNDQHVAIYCSTDAIIPKWAYMILASKIAPIAKSIVYGNQSVMENTLIRKAIDEMNVEEYVDKKIVIKGCGTKKISEASYLELTNRLLPVASSIMYGEPCSTVPVYKKR